MSTLTSIGSSPTRHRDLINHPAAKAFKPTIQALFEKAQSELGEKDSQLRMLKSELEMERQARIKAEAERDAAQSSLTKMQADCISSKERLKIKIKKLESQINAYRTANSELRELLSFEKRSPRTSDVEFEVNVSIPSPSVTMLASTSSHTSVTMKASVRPNRSVRAVRTGHPSTQADMDKRRQRISASMQKSSDPSITFSYI